MMLKLLFALIASQTAPGASEEMAAPDASGELKRAMATLDVVTDEKMYAIFDPYFECSMAAIERSPASNLKDDAATLRMFEDAVRSCSAEQTAAVAVADTYLTTLQPAQSTSERADLLLRVRRTIGVFKINEFFARKGLGEQFEGYLGRYYRARDKAGAK